jgi:hypothetical protein
MAEKENIRDRVRRLNPKALALSDQIEAAMRAHGFSGHVVDLTEDMTDEEQEMAIFEGLIKEGFSPQEAEVMAGERLNLLRKVLATDRLFYQHISLPRKARLKSSMKQPESPCGVLHWLHV